MSEGRLRCRETWQRVRGLIQWVDQAPDGFPGTGTAWFPGLGFGWASVGWGPVGAVVRRPVSRGSRTSRSRDWRGWRR